MKKMMTLSLALFTACSAWAGEVLFDGSQAAAWPKNVKQIEKGTFSADGRTRVFGSKKFEVKTDKTIRISGDFRLSAASTSDSLLFCFGFQAMSNDGYVIDSINVNPNSVIGITQVVADADKGDKKIIVKNLAKLTNYKHVRLAFWVKKDFSDLPNRKLSPAITKVTKQDDGSYAVEFKSPLTFDVPAGTALRVHNASSTFIYAGSKGFAKLGKEWTSFNATIKNSRIGAASNVWWKGTAAANVVFFINGPAKNDFIEFRNIKVEIVD